VVTKFYNRFIRDPRTGWAGWAFAHPNILADINLNIEFHGFAHPNILADIEFHGFAHPIFSTFSGPCS